MPTPKPQRRLIKPPRRADSVRTAKPSKPQRNKTAGKVRAKRSSKAVKAAGAAPIETAAAAGNKEQAT